MGTKIRKLLLIALISSLTIIACNLSNMSDLKQDSEENLVEILDLAEADKQLVRNGAIVASIAVTMAAVAFSVQKGRIPKTGKTNQLAEAVSIEADAVVDDFLSSKNLATGIGWVNGSFIGRRGIYLTNNSDELLLSFDKPRISRAGRLDTLNILNHHGVSIGSLKAYSPSQPFGESGWLLLDSTGEELAKIPNKGLLAALFRESGIEITSPKAFARSDFRNGVIESLQNALSRETLNQRAIRDTGYTAVTALAGTGIHHWAPQLFDFGGILASSKHFLLNLAHHDNPLLGTLTSAVKHHTDDPATAARNFDYFKDQVTTQLRSNHETLSHARTHLKTVEDHHRELFTSGRYTEATEFQKQYLDPANKLMNTAEKQYYATRLAKLNLDSVDHVTFLKRLPLVGSAEEQFIRFTRWIFHRVDDSGDLAETGGKLAINFGKGLHQLAKANANP